MLGQRQKQSFAEQGYVVVPQAVPRSLVAAALRSVYNLACADADDDA